MKVKKINPVLVASDLPTWGRVALAVSIPVLEKEGIQACALPTALLSTHGAYQGAVIKNETSYIASVKEHLDTLNLQFSALLTGFVAEQNQFTLLESFAQKIKNTKGLVLIDPVMGDSGKLYSFFDSDFIQRMRTFVRFADIVTPNLTEAAFLLKKDPAFLPQTKELIVEWLKELALMGPRFCLITSVTLSEEPSKTGVAFFDAHTNKTHFLMHKKISVQYPGTGDLFAAQVLVGLLKGKSLYVSARKAVKRVRRALSNSEAEGELRAQIGLDSRAGLKVL